MGRRVVVTGATGFIGWHVATRLRDEGWEVGATVRPNRRKPLPDGVKPLPVSLTGGTLASAWRGTDAVVHLAGVTQATADRHFREANVVATAAVAEAARDVGARLIHVSSQAAGGPAPREAPLREDAVPNPITPYGVSKLAGERVVRATDGLRWTILRPASVYGPRDRGFLTVFRLAQRGVFLTTGSASTAFTLVHVDDVVRAIGLAANLQTPSQDVFFVGHPQHPTERDMWRVLARLFNRRFRPIAVPRPFLQAWALVGDLAGLVGVPAAMNRARLRELSAGGFVCSVDKAAATLGFSAAIDLKGGFGSTAAWYREQGWL